MFDYYEYIDGTISLTFKFKKGDANKEEKTKFLTMLKQATQDLESELK